MVSGCAPPPRLARVTAIDDVPPEMIVWATAEAESVKVELVKPGPTTRLSAVLEFTRVNMYLLVPTLTISEVPLLLPSSAKLLFAKPEAPLPVELD